jgi:hypothetical protein
MIDDLLDICSEFIVNCVDENNCLDIFIKTEHFDIAVIEKKCFEFICDNPFYYFRNLKFHEISASGLGKLIKQPKFNCTTRDLIIFAASWFDNNYLEKHAGLKEIDFENKTPLKLSFNWLGQVSLEEFSEMTLYVKKNAIYLYGIAVYSGMYDETQKAVAYDAVRILIEDFNYPTGPHRLYSEKIEKVIKTNSLITAHSNVATIEHIMFEKTYMPNSYMRVTIDFGTKRKRPVNTSSVCTDAHNHRDAECIMTRPRSPLKNSCLAYLLYADNV